MYKFGDFKSMRVILIMGALAVSTPGSSASFSEVWSATKSGVYAELPEYQTSLLKLFRGITSVLAKSANRTLNNNADILPRFQKLVHPTGICFAGTWQIEADSGYTGYFARGSSGLVILRASEAMGYNQQGSYRSFGLAGKIFPTMNPDENLSVPTANFFTVDDLGGTMARSFLDTSKSNAPATSMHLSRAFAFPLMAEITRVFSLADANPSVRQLYPISELNARESEQVVTPEYMSLVAETEERARSTDFRDELRLQNYEHGLTFGIFVSEDAHNWRRLGRIELTADVVSDGCDHQLHFQHPKWK